ncbi:MAG: ABC transporter ATP-binding protein [Campylobacterales bacterium]|nr:ABC transporter ATP-binding protein [Campylobacterales bacterium]
MELRPVIDVKNLHFSYKKHQVLAGVDLKLYKGEIISLLGPNGCGKSTLIRLILKLLRGNGEILINNKDIEKYSHKEIASRIAYIPQYNNTPFNYSVMEMVLMGRVSKLDYFASPSAHDFEIAKNALKKVGVEHLKEKAFGQLSGGQKQMVLLARAIAQEVDTFIMDEPVAGLDYGNQIRLLELIHELSKQGYTFLKTTHYPDHALLISSRVIVMNDGKIIANGTPDKVITKEMIQDVYSIKADIIVHDSHKRCIPIFQKNILNKGF